MDVLEELELEPLESHSSSRGFESLRAHKTDKSHDLSVLFNYKRVVRTSAGVQNCFIILKS